LRKSSKTEKLSPERLARRQLALVSLALLAACILALAYVGPLAQDETYHAFADRRTLFGIPNFWNVVSNLPFAVIGVIGLARARSLAPRIIFLGVFLTAFGSAYYHWSPNDARLIWDRLPMTLVFMALFAMVIAERFPSLNWLTIPLVLLGLASILAWRFTGDLRFYALVQFAPMVLIPVMLLMMPKSPGLWWVILFYALAKIAESADTRVYHWLPLSGHTLKHFLAAASTWFLARWPRAAS